MVLIAKIFRFCYGSDLAWSIRHYLFITTKKKLQKRLVKDIKVSQKKKKKSNIGSYKLVEYRKKYYKMRKNTSL